MLTHIKESFEVAKFELIIFRYEVITWSIEIFYLVLREMCSSKHPSKLIQSLNVQQWRHYMRVNANLIIVEKVSSYPSPSPWVQPFGRCVLHTWLLANLPHACAWSEPSWAANLNTSSISRRWQGITTCWFIWSSSFLWRWWRVI